MRWVPWVVLAWSTVASARPAQLVVAMERTACFGSCPEYKVAIYDDGVIRWLGKANVARKGAATAKIDPARVQELAAAFVKAQFFAMDPDGTIPPPLPKGAMRTLSVPCTDHSHAITTFRQGKQARTLDDPHCKGATPLTELEHLVDEVADSKAFIGE